MATPKPIWRGHLRLALVSCPVALFSVVRGGSGLHFHLINPKTSHRVRMVSQDAETDEEVSRGDLVKGYEFEKDLMSCSTTTTSSRLGSRVQPP
jgi:DNA end-binding protein Ku